MYPSGLGPPDDKQTAQDHEDHKPEVEENRDVGKQSERHGEER
jgi:hypothetical protein